jgi:co-chaperonin GroES (HSP10)
MRIPKNYVIVKVSEETERTFESKLVDKDGNKVQLIIPTFKDDAESLKHNRIYGEVVSVCGSLHKTQPYYREYPGFPAPSAYRSGEVVAKLVKPRTERALTPEELKEARALYQCNPYEDKYCWPKIINVKPGDKVYFHYLVINDKNYMGKDGDFKLFRADYTSLICKIDGAKHFENIIPLNGYVLAEKKFDPDTKVVDVDGHDIRVKLTGSGLVAEIKEDAEPMLGYVRHREDHPHLINWQYREDIYNGDLILFLSYASMKSGKIKTWENKIEDKIYYTLREWDIVAFYYKALSTFYPCGDYVKIKPEAYKEGSIVIPDQYKVPPEQGEVIFTPNWNEGIPVNRGDWVHYNRKSQYTIRHDGYVYVRKADISMITDRSVTVRVKGKQLEKYRKF